MMKNKIQPRITLVGAGPGDPELITLKGWKALKNANVVLYDALVSEEVLAESAENALLIFVGKRADNHSYSQDEINMMMVQYAYTHGHVVRLKGGDPFVFGRGHEELQFATAFDIDVEIVPGISSCIAVPELQKIPLTRRGVNESFWVLTGTTKSGKLSKDIAMAAQSSATAVILMGLRKLPEIADTFSKNGKGNIPALVIQNGSRTDEDFALGTVDTIVEKVNGKKLGTPAIIVIGEVVKLHPELNLLALKQQKNEH